MAYGPDRFDSVKVCDRCEADLSVGKIMSWFTEEVICMDCSAVEDKIKGDLRDNKFNDHEGCGYVPNVPKMILNRDIEMLKRQKKDPIDILNWKQRRDRRRLDETEALIEKFNETEDEAILEVLNNMICWDAEELELKRPEISNEAYLATLTKEE